MMRLLDNARVYAYDPQAARFVRHRSVLLDGTRIAALDETPAGIGVERIDLGGLTIVPAFTDCHVHLAETGYNAGDRSLRSVSSYAQYAERIERSRPEHGMLYMGQFDDALWPDGSADALALERTHPDAVAMIVRIDGHSCIVNRKTLEWLDLPAAANGIERDERGEPTGRLFYDANWSAQKTLLERMPIDVVRAAERRAADAALSAGIVAVHAQLLGRDADGYAADIESFRELPITVHPKICEPDARLAQRFDLPYVGGDVFLDGSIGSCTAALEDPYLAGGYGALRFSDEELFTYFSQAEELGVSAGVHAIGDAAIDQCVRTWTRVLNGRPSTRGSRHFIEHFEMASQEQIDACASMQIHLSMQPQFDAYWGGAGGMYENRLGMERTRAMNAFRRILQSGAPLCAGSDSPVCTLDALAGMQACLEHHEASQRLTVHEALMLYTVAAARFGFVENETGNVLPGLHADLAVLDGDPFERGGFAKIAVLQTYRQGERLR